MSEAITSRTRTGSRVPKNLRELRLSRQWTREYVATLIGCSDSAVRSWEEGRSMPGADLGLAAAKLYGVSVEMIVALVQKAMEERKKREEVKEE